jgi:hypothetical protein
VPRCISFPSTQTHVPEAITSPLLLEEGFVHHGGSARKVGVGVDHRHAVAVEIHVGTLVSSLAALVMFSPSYPTLSFAAAALLLLPCLVPEPISLQSFLVSEIDTKHREMLTPVSLLLLPV